MTSVKILILDPDESSDGALKEILDKLGYQVVHTARSAHEFYSMIDKFGAELVLMDIRLRGHPRGFPTGSLIREQHDVPVMYIVHRDSHDLVGHAGPTGSFGFIIEPFEKNHVFANIETALARHRLETQLAENLQWFNTILTSIGDGVVAVDRKGAISYINTAGAKLTGCREDWAVGRSLGEVVVFKEEVSGNSVDFLSLKGASPERGSKSGVVGYLHSLDGGVSLVEVNVNLNRDARGKLFGNVLVLRDVSAEREATREVRRQASRAEALLKTAARLSGQFDSEQVLMTICMVNNQMLHAAGTAVILPVFGKESFRVAASYSEHPAFRALGGTHFDINQAVLPRPLTRQDPVLMIPDIREYPHIPLQPIFDQLRIKSIVIAVMHHGETLLGAVVTAFTRDQEIPRLDEIALLKGLADQASSAYENARLFEQIRAGRESQWQLAKSLVNVQEAERRHIARELHDQLGQVLTGLQFMLEGVKTQAAGSFRMDLEEVQKSVSDVIAQIREMSLNLRPSLLDDVGLVPTLVWHFERYTNQTGIKVKLLGEQFTRRLPPEIETAAYRIIQEALTNTARHAQVEEVTVELELHEQAVTLTVSDQGRGFETGLDHAQSTSGLGGMHERAALVGGYIKILSAPGHGTKIQAVLPLAGAHLERRKHDRYDPAD
ncbi:MAG: response regulator [Chloroflexi bacterium]|nr:response regulator [Chloroflexota bacterium]